MTGTRMDPAPARNGSGPLYYRGHFNIEAQLDSLVATKGLGTFEEVVLSGCSAGGMACYLKCDYVAGYFAKHGIPVKCICDAGMFLDIETVTGAGNVMQTRYHDIADNMESRPGLSPACVAGEADWRQCMFSQHTFAYTRVPTFVLVRKDAMSCLQALPHTCANDVTRDLIVTELTLQLWRMGHARTSISGRAISPRLGNPSYRLAAVLAQERSTQPHQLRPLQRHTGRPRPSVPPGLHTGCCPGHQPGIAARHLRRQLS